MQYNPFEFFDKQQRIKNYHVEHVSFSKHNPLANRWSITLEWVLWKEMNLHLETNQKIDWAIIQRRIPNKTINAIKSKWRDLKKNGGPSKPNPNKKNPTSKPKHKWTVAEKNFIIRNKQYYTYTDLQKKINEWWGVNATIASLKSLIYRNKKGV